MLINFHLFFFPLGGWLKLNDAPVCIGAKNDAFGKFFFNDSCITTEAMFVCFKLIHRSGMVRCTNDVSANSKWGCNVSNFECALGIVLSDETNNVIFPKKRLVKFLNDTLFYENPPFDGQSKAILTCDYTSPVCFLPGQELRLWYAEDLRNQSEADNSGEVCVDVYGLVSFVHH